MRYGHDRGVPIDLGSWGWSDPEEIESFKRNYGLSGFTAVEVDPMKFSRFLARIAYASAIVRLGPDAFEPIGIDNILGLNPSMNLYVGSGDLSDMEWPDANRPTHQFKHFFHSDTGVVMIALRLFAHLDPPTYHVVVGHQAGGGIVKIMEQLPPFRKETEHPFPFEVHVNKNQ